MAKTAISAPTENSKPLIITQMAEILEKVMTGDVEFHEVVAVLKRYNEEYGGKDTSGSSE